MNARSHRIPASLLVLVATVAAYSTTPAVAKVTARPSEMRELKILAIADQSYRDKFSSWEDRIRNLMTGASSHFEEHFGICFTVADLQPWECTASGDLNDSVQRLLRTNPDGHDIVVAFTAKLHSCPSLCSLRTIEGLAFPFGQHAIISDASHDRTRARFVLLHELGHLFGAFHVDDRKSVMRTNARVSPLLLSIDEANQEVIRSARDVNFHRGADSLDEATRAHIRGVYRGKCARDLKRCDDSMTLSYLGRATRANVLREFDQATTWVRKALAVSPDSSAAHTVLGGISLAREDGVEAERCFRRALEIDERNDDARVGLATVLFDRTDLEGADSLLHRVVVRQPEHRAARFVRALCRHYANDVPGHIADMVFLERAAPEMAANARRLIEKLGKEQLDVERKIREEASKAPTLRNSIGMKMALIEPTRTCSRRLETALPSTVYEGQEGRTQEAQIGERHYYLGTTEVTQGQFARVMGRNPSKFSSGGDEYPVESVTWEEAVEFCHRLSNLPAEKRTGATYQLPTEAEWEYACRAGTTGRYFFGTKTSWLGDYAWGGEFPWFGGGPHPVARKAPNQWGLHDMLGNVWEWCSDRFEDAVTTEQGDP